MKKFLFLAILGLFAFSVSAAEISCVSPPVYQETKVFSFDVVHQDFIVDLQSTETVVINQEITSFVSCKVVLIPFMSFGYVYHPLDYEGDDSSITYTMYKCRNDIMPSVVLKMTGQLITSKIVKSYFGSFFLIDSIHDDTKMV